MAYKRRLRLRKGSPGPCQPVIQPAWPRRSLRRSTREAAQPQVKVPTRSWPAAVQEKLEQDNSDDIARAIEVAGDLTKLNQTFSQSHSIFLDLPRRKVFRYGNIVIKFGLDVSPCEAKVLRFIDETTNIPVPRLYYDHVHSEGTAVIAMEHVKGRILSKVWPTLCNSEKMKIVQQLREILEKMQQHQRNFIGGIHGTPAVDIRMGTREGGPFSTEEQFNQFLRSGMIPAAPKIYCWMLEGAMKKDHDIVLTHGDINPRNIIVNSSQIVAHT